MSFAFIHFWNNHASDLFSGVDEPFLSLSSSSTLHPITLSWYPTRTDVTVVEVVVLFLVAAVIIVAEPMNGFKRIVLVTATAGSPKH